jgi:hypothetical protein
MTRVRRFKLPAKTWLLCGVYWRMSRRPAAWRLEQQCVHLLGLQIGACNQRCSCCTHPGQALEDTGCRLWTLQRSRLKEGSPMACSMQCQPDCKAMARAARGHTLHPTSVAYVGSGALLPAPLRCYICKRKAPNPSMFKTGTSPWKHGLLSGGLHSCIIACVCAHRRDEA